MSPQDVSLTSDSADETRAIAAALVSRLPVSLVVLLLTGLLGSGKTTFVQGIAKGLGISGVIASPSFLLMKDYFEGSRPMRHIDLYRLSHIDETASLGLVENLHEEAVVAIEWADRFDLRIPAPTVKVSFEKGNAEGERRLVFSADTEVISSEKLNALCAD